MPAANVGEQIASVLLEEIEKGGVVDSTHQVCISKYFIPLTCHLSVLIFVFPFYYFDNSLSTFKHLLKLN